MRRPTVLVLALTLALAALSAGCVGDTGPEEAGPGDGGQDVVTSSEGVTTRGQNASLPPLDGAPGAAAETAVFPLVNLTADESYNETFVFDLQQDSVVLVLSLVNEADQPVRVRATMVTPGPPEPEPLTVEQALVLPAGGGGAMRLTIAAPDLPGQSDRLEPAVLMEADGPVRVSGTFYLGVPGLP